MVHIYPTPASYSEKEPLYKVTGREIQPKQVGEELGEIIFKYYPMSSVNYVRLYNTIMIVIHSSVHFFNF